MRKLFVVLIGNIGSGKSTLCKALHKEGFVICSRDSMRYMIGAGDYVFDTDLEPALADAHDEMVNGFLYNDIDVVIDEVNVQKRRRMQLARIAEEYNYTTIAISLAKLTKEECVARRMKNEHGKFGAKVWGQVWERFNTAYTDPVKEEGFDHIIRMKKDTKVEDVIKRIRRL